MHSSLSGYYNSKSLSTINSQPCWPPFPCEVVNLLPHIQFSPNSKPCKGAISVRGCEAPRTNSPLTHSLLSHIPLNPKHTSHHIRYHIFLIMHEILFGMIFYYDVHVGSLYKRLLGQLPVDLQKMLHSRFANKN